METIAAVDRKRNPKVDGVDFSTNSPSQEPVLSPKFGKRGPYPAKEFSQENLIHSAPHSPTNKDWPLPAPPLDLTDRAVGKPLSPGHVNIPPPVHPRPSIRTPSFQSGDDLFLRQPQYLSGQASLQRKPAPEEPSPITHTIPNRQSVTVEAPEGLHRPQSALISSVRTEEPTRQVANPNHPSLSHTRNISGGSAGSLGKISENAALHGRLDFDHDKPDRGFNLGLDVVSNSRPHLKSSKPASPPPPPVPPLPPKHSVENPPPTNQHLTLPRHKPSSFSLPRPSSAYSSSSEHGLPRRARSPQRSPNPYDRAPSNNSWRSPESRPLSYVDLLNVPYPQPPPAPTNLDNAHLRTAVGNNASLLSTKQTLDMYRANVKKTNDPTIQYEFAIFMINTAREALNTQSENGKPKEVRPKSKKEESPTTASQAELLREARLILQRLADRSYPFAQYYLADGYASGLFNKGAEDLDRAFPLFVAASKHGHAEAGYRAALCYEFGWGTRKDPFSSSDSRPRRIIRARWRDWERHV
jgi:hypothetical protein